MVDFRLLPPKILDGHSWLSHPRGPASGPGLAGLAAARGTHHLLVTHGHDDPLFTPAAQQAADETLTRAFAGRPGSFTARWFDGGHAFTHAAQEAAADHFAAALAGR